jgi:hypothetical protein
VYNDSAVILNGIEVLLIWNYYQIKILQFRMLFIGE